MCGICGVSMSNEWTRYIPDGTRTWVMDASCCSGRYELLQEGGAYVVTRRRPYSPSREETARGAASLAMDVFRDLVAQHLTETTKHRP